jgi:malonate decarboxylase beta subunit
MNASQPYPAAAAPPLHSFQELRPRERARALLDAGTFRELLDPFERIRSPWLEPPGIIPQSDDGVVVARGTIDARPAVCLATDGAFQGGSLGEVSGAKIAGSLELALEESRAGRLQTVVFSLDTGGVRLQEANLGLAAIAEAHAAIVALKSFVPVIAVIAGPVGCFGGMSITAALCSKLIVTPDARLGLSGPDVIEQEAGIAEMDASDRPAVWSIMGGEQRYACSLAHDLVADDIPAIRGAVLRASLPDSPGAAPCIDSIRRHLEWVRSLDPSRSPSPLALREGWTAADVACRR